MDKNLAPEILQKIEDKKITPKPKWYYDLKEWIMVGVAFVSLILGGAAIALMAFVVINNDWDVRQLISQNFFKFIIGTFPHLLFIILGLIILFFVYDVRKIEGLYRYRLITLIIASMAISTLLGGILYYSGLPKKFDSDLAGKSKFYREYVNRNHERWLHPEQGFLAGQILGRDDNGDFKIRALDGKEWTVVLPDALKEQLPPVRKGMPIRVMGEKNSDSEFVAERLAPIKTRDLLPMPPIEIKSERNNFKPRR